MRVERIVDVACQANDVFSILEALLHSLFVLRLKCDKPVNIDKSYAKFNDAELTSKIEWACEEVKLACISSDACIVNLTFSDVSIEETWSIRIVMADKTPKLKHIVTKHILPAQTPFTLNEKVKFDLELPRHEENIGLKRMLRRMLRQSGAPRLL